MSSLLSPHSLDDQPSFPHRLLDDDSSNYNGRHGNGHPHTSRSISSSSSSSSSSSFSHHLKPHLTVALPSSPHPSIHPSSHPHPTPSPLPASSFLPSPLPLHPHTSSWYLPFSTDDLPPLSILFYSCGHFLNDLCAACWFTYLLVMLRDARHLVSYKSAMVLLAGQVADAIATPLCGILSDRSTGVTLGPLRLERRQTWYVFGTVLVAINFLFIFGIPLPLLINPECPQWGLLVYYCLAASLFNVGWAAVQVSHMSMVPELSQSEHTRVVLNSARYSESVVANVAVFGILAVWSALIHDSEGQYTGVSYTTLTLGLLASLVFLFGVREKPARRRRHKLQHSDSLNSLAAPLSPDISDPASPLSPSSSSSLSPPPDAPPARCCGGLLSLPPTGGWRVWLHTPDFYKVGWVYMHTRIVVNVSQVFLAFYTLDVLLLPTVYITIVPCVVYISSFLAALAMKRVNRALGRRVITAIGSIFCILALVLLYFLHPETAHLIFVPAVLLGIGNGTVMVMSTQLEADLIGRRTEHGAFVYGALSFTDKLANGLAIFALQSGNADVVEGDEGVTNDPEYIRWSVVALPLVSSVCALVMVIWGIDVERLIERGNDVSHLMEEDEEGEEGGGGGVVGVRGNGEHGVGSISGRGREEDEADGSVYKPPLFSEDGGDGYDRHGNGDAEHG